MVFDEKEHEEKMRACQKSTSYCNFEGEILALLCSDYPIQTVLIFPHFQLFGTEVKLAGSVYVFSD